jgi:hypothetical protein
VISALEKAKPETDLTSAEKFANPAALVEEGVRSAARRISTEAIGPSFVDDLTNVDTMARPQDWMPLVYEKLPRVNSPGSSLAVDEDLKDVLALG